MTINSKNASRCLLAKEVIQTSNMDCGPAALKCLLESFGRLVSYGRLREACQTDVDGTSVDTLEEIAVQLGLEAEQVILPLDHLLLPESRALPAMVVVQLSSGLTHVVVVWRRHGPFVQLMDPATGRRWISTGRFLKDVYIHELQVAADDWEEWAQSPDFLIPLGRRLHDLGLSQLSSALIEEAIGNCSWIGLATLDAATRLTSSLVRNKAMKPGHEAGKFLKAILRRSAEAPGNEQNIIPARYWSVRPAPLAETEIEESVPLPQQLWLKGAILIRVRGCQTIESSSTQHDPATEDDTTSPLLYAALKEGADEPLRELFRLMRGYGGFSWFTLTLGLILTAVTLIFEIFLLRGVLDIGYSVNLISQRLLAAGCFFAYILLIVKCEFGVASALLHLGRRLEINLRIAIFSTIPTLADQYFRSRPVSDMAERAHNSHQLRMLPRLGGQFARTSLALIISGCAMIWLYPQGTFITLLAISVGLLVPLIFIPHLQELDLRVRTHTGALIRFYLDSMLGVRAVRAHSAEHAMMREQEFLLVEWYRAGHQRLRSNVLLEGLQTGCGFGWAVYLLFSYINTVGDPAGAILLAYLALNVPVLGEEIVLLVRQYPIYRNLTLRLLELLKAPIDPSLTLNPSSLMEECKQSTESAPSVIEQSHSVQISAKGTTIILDSVTVRAGGHVILDNLDLRIDAGEHVAVIGASGAGKSSLAGLFLGWHQTNDGQLRIDGLPINRARLENLRQETVWIDPAVQLWNRKLLANLTYGARQCFLASLTKTLDDVDLLDLLERLPEGLQTRLGEGGGLVSGGEGQRVRIARGFLRSHPRFVVLDEAFRGLERSRRETLLKLARERWRDATLLCITHDVDHTRNFDRVLVLEAGRIVEHGSPATLAENAASRYRSILDADAEVRSKLWDEEKWLHLRLHQGQLHTTSNRYARR